VWTATYGTAAFGGAGGTGTGFRVTTAGVVTTLHGFAADCSDGRQLQRRVRLLQPMAVFLVRTFGLPL
jgi:uncharacterized repeat protein (TIGR03803 family)